MVPQNSQHSTSSMYLRQQIRARLDESGSSLPPAQIFLEQWDRHEIAGQRNEVGFHSIDNVDRFANRHYRKMFVVMEIAHLRDSDSIPLFGQARERNFDLHQLRIIRLNNRAVNSQAQSARHPHHRARAEKLPSGGANAQMSYLVLVVHSEKLGVGGRFAAANGHQTSPQSAPVNKKSVLRPPSQSYGSSVPKTDVLEPSGAKSPFDHGSSRPHKHAANRLS